MANDSHRKHHRSTSDDDSPETSKRSKNRHHNHRSNHDDATNNDISSDNKESTLEDVTVIVTKNPPQDDYDMEEGEILEDEPSIAEKTVVSDVESGEFKADDLRDDFDASYTSVDAGSDQSGEFKDGRGKSHCVELLAVERIANGDLASRSSKDESRSHSRHASPGKERRKEKERRRSASNKPGLDVMEVDDDYGDRRNSHSYQVGEICGKATYRSPSLGRNCLETKSDSTRSESPYQRRESSQNDSHLKRRHRYERDERLYGNGKVGHAVDDERDSRIGTYFKADDGEKGKDMGSDRGSSYHIYSNREGKLEDDSWDPKTSKERSERDHYRDREKVIHSYRRRENDFVRDRERPRETKSDRDRGGSWDKDLDRERDRRWEKNCDRSRDKAPERERKRDGSVSLHRDNDREWDKAKDRSRKPEMDSIRDRYSDRDRHREKARDDEDDRRRRCHKYGDRDDGYGNRGRRRGYEEAESGKDKKTKRDHETDETSNPDSVKETEDGMYRDVYDQDDQQEMVMLKPAEQEDDVNRIKEESRKRREAILQKYKAKQSQQPQQQQQAVPLIPKVSDEQLKEQLSQDLASSNAVQKDSNGIKDNGKSSMDNHLIAAERSTVLGEGSPKSEKSNDMFCDDIFGDSPAGARKMGKGDGLLIDRSGLHDNWDDPEGYYSFRLAEILDSRYEIKAAHGKGVFSTVVRAKDLKAGTGDPDEVAIKIIRNNETMLKAGTEELVILKKLVGADPEDRRHCVRYLSHFKYRNHLCIVFECLHMNLREVLKKFGRNIGLKLTAVRTYAKQLFIALKHLRNCGVLHCDIKPDNMLVNDSKNVLKLCDFGNAMFAGKNEITPYLVSRFYRAPEIILGLPYDHPMDIWSVGCCLYELYTGKVLFPGHTNNDMLRLHMELKGPFPKKMLRKGAFIEQHFDQDLNFLAVEEDPVTKKAIRRLMVNIKPKDIGNIIRGSTGEDPKILSNFKDLLDKIFVLDPDKRLTVSQALNHPFITGK